MPEAGKWKRRKVGKENSKWLQEVSGAIQQTDWNLCKTYTNRAVLQVLGGKGAKYQRYAIFRK